MGIIQNARIRGLRKLEEDELLERLRKYHVKHDHALAKGKKSDVEYWGVMIVEAQGVLKGKYKTKDPFAKKYERPTTTHRSRDATKSFYDTESN